MHHRRNLVVLLAFVTAAALGGCSSQADTESSAADPPTPSSSATTEADSPTAEPNGSASPGSGSPGSASAESTSPSVGGDPDDEVPEILQFEATALDGSTFEGSSLAGKPTVFWFWAPWCPTCRGQIPAVEAVAAEYAGDVNVVGVGGLDSDSAIEEFAGELDGMTLLVDEAGLTWQRFEVTEQSSFVILDAGGQEVARSGYGDDIDLSSEVAGLLN